MEPTREGIVQNARENGLLEAENLSFVMLPFSKKKIVLC